MWFTKLGHSCVRLEKDGAILVDEPVRTLLLPIVGPWLKAAEMIDYFRAVARPPVTRPRCDLERQRPGRHDQDDVAGRRPQRRARGPAVPGTSLEL
jgi:hypothetical protein